MKVNCDKADVEELGDVGKDFCVTALQKRELSFCWQSTKTGTSFNDGMKCNILFVPRNTVFDFIRGFFFISNESALVSRGSIAMRQGSALFVQ